MTDKEDPARQGTLEGTRAIAYGAAGDNGTARDSDGAPDFLADLARAMQAAASAQRKHIADVAEERKKTHIDSIHAREQTEKQELREVADQDVKGIEAWATAEIERIRLERQRRIAARKTELERQVEQHHAMIESEIGAVEAAVVAYHQDVDSFFARLDVQADPIAIAETARNLPPFPALETIGRDNGESALNGAGRKPDEPVSVPAGPEGSTEAARQRSARQDIQSGADPREPAPTARETATGTAGAASSDIAPGEPVAVGQAENGTPAAGPEAAVATGQAPRPIPAAVTPWEGPGEATDAATGDEAAGIGTGPKITPRSSGAVIQSVPSLRPIGSWLRRTNNSNSNESND